jgi:hypothetical protein
MTLTHTVSEASHILVRGHDHIHRHADAREVHVDPLFQATPMRHLGLDHQQVDVAIRTYLPVRGRPEQNEPIRLRYFHHAGHDQIEHGLIYRRGSVTRLGTFLCLRRGGTRMPCHTILLQITPASTPPARRVSRRIENVGRIPQRYGGNSTDATSCASVLFPKTQTALCAQAERPHLALPAQVATPHRRSVGRTGCSLRALRQDTLPHHACRARPTCLPGEPMQLLLDRPCVPSSPAGIKPIPSTSGALRSDRAQRRRARCQGTQSEAGHPRARPSPRAVPRGRLRQCANLNPGPQPSVPRRPAGGLLLLRRLVQRPHHRTRLEKH